MFPDLTRDDVFRLETRRLWLRWPRLADAAVLAALVGDKAVADMTGQIPHPYPDGEATRHIALTRARNAEGRQLGLALTFKSQPDGLVGMMSAVFDQPGGPRLIYWVGEPFWGQGLATEAAQAVIDCVFTLTAAAEIAATSRVINPASRRVLEKCGFAYVGSGLETLPARGGMVPCDRLRLDRKAWASLKGWRMPGWVRAPRRAPTEQQEACVCVT